MAIRLVINGVDADLYQNESIIGSYKGVEVGNLAVRTGARSIQFKLPKTNNNKSIFESSEVVTSFSDKPYQRLDCKLYVDGIDMKMYFLTLEDVDFTYNVRVYGTESKFFAIIKDAKLQDLDLDYLNHHWDIDAITRFNDPPNDPIVYAALDYNSDSPNAGINNTDKGVYMGVLPPAFKEHFILEQICIQNGYSLVNLNENKPIFKYADPIIDALSSEYKRGIHDIPQRYLGRFDFKPNYGVDIGTPLYVAPIVDSISGTVTPYWSLGSTMYVNPPNAPPETYHSIFTFCEDVEITVHYEGDITNDSSVDPIFILNVEIREGDTFPVASQNFTNIPPSGTVHFSLDATLNVKKAFSAVFAPYPYVSLSFFLPGLIFGDAFTLSNTFMTINSAKYLNNKDNDSILYNGLVPTTDNYITPANCLPEFSHAEFLKQYCLKTNSLIVVDENTKVVTIRCLQDIIDNMSNALDWSGKLDYTTPHKTSFTSGDYAQNNILKYADDDSVVKPTGTDKTFVVSDENLPAEKIIIESKYSASEEVVRFGGINIANIDAFESLEFKEQPNPRCLLVKYETDTFYYKKTPLSDSDPTKETITANVPYAYFIDPARTYSYGFDTNLSDQFYSSFFGRLEKQKQVTCRMRLNAVDVANYNAFLPVYIKEFDAHFIVLSIKYNYTTKGSTEVELLKLL